MPSSSPMGTYLYCIAQAQPFEGAGAAFHAPAIAGSAHPVRLLRYRDLAAVVSDVPVRRLDVTREHLLRHEGVIVEAMEQSEVIPFSFGTIAPSDEAIIGQVLQAAYDDLLQQFAAIRGCVELDLKVFWQQERLYTELVEENEHIRALRRGIERAPINDRIELGRLTSEALAFKSEQEAQSILDELEPLALEARSGRLLNEMMVLNTAFLVELPQREALERTVSELAVSQEGRLRFRLVGPVPPYHFVDVQLQWEEVKHGAD